MRKIYAICALGLVLGALAGCRKCEVEPIVEQNQRLIVPPNFGRMPTGD